jgi:hypothetical protein
MLALDGKTGAILGKFQATVGDVWNGTSSSSPARTASSSSARARRRASTTRSTARR